MLTRRNMLRWSVGIAVSLVSDLELATLGSRSATSNAQEPDQSVDVSIETWMNEWMSISKTPGGMLKLSRFREPIYFLNAPISWYPRQGQERYEAVTVPPGFVTDFASIPQIFWSVLRPDGEYAYAAVIHDYLYWFQTRPRQEADYIFRMAMEDFGIGTATASVIYNAVRLIGKAAWNGNAEQRSQGEKRILTRFPQDPRMRWDDWKHRPGVFDP